MAFPWVSPLCYPFYAFSHQLDLTEAKHSTDKLQLLVIKSEPQHQHNHRTPQERSVPHEDYDFSAGAQHLLKLPVSLRLILLLMALDSQTRLFAVGKDIHSIFSTHPSNWL